MPEPHDNRSEPDRPPSAGAGGESGDLSGWYRMAGLGIEFILALIVPGLIGYWLDRKLGTGHWLLIVGGGLGFAAGLMLLVRAANRSFRK